MQCPQNLKKKYENFFEELLIEDGMCACACVSHVSEESLQILGIFLRAFNLSLMAMARMPAMPHASFLQPASISSSTLHISSELHLMNLFLQDCGH